MIALTNLRHLIIGILNVVVLWATWQLIGFEGAVVLGIVFVLDELMEIKDSVQNS